MLDELEGTPQITSELALFNKVGDLYLKISKVPEAVDMYERAVNLYADQGFPNNAIALCNKILRNAPGRTHIYLKLAQLMVERGFVAEAKQNLLEYAERMQKAGKTDEAFRALKEFADLSPDNEEIRLLLADQLKAAARDDEAREQLDKLYAEARAHGDDRRSRATLRNIKAIDPDYDESSAAHTEVKAKKAKTSELIFLDVEYDTDSARRSTEEPPVEAAPVEIEPTAVEPPVEEAAPVDLEIERASVQFEEEVVEPAGAVEGLDIGAAFESGAEVEVPSLEIEHTSLVEEEEPVEAATSVPEVEAVEEIEAVAEPVGAPDVGGDLETFDFGDEEEAAVETPAAEGDIDVPDLDFGAAMEEDILGAPVVDDAAPDLAPAGAAAAEPELETLEDIGADIELPEMALDEAESAPDFAAVAAPEVSAPDVGALEAAVADDPDDEQHHIALGEALIETGQRERGIEELGIAAELYEAGEEWNRAARIADEIIRLDSENIKFQQKRVEYAYRIGDKGQLMQAYMSLADALFRSGAVERAVAVYHRVLEHDADNSRALEALATLEPAEAEEGRAAPTLAPAPAAPGGDFIDLGALVMDDEPQRDLRMRVEDEEPTGDEEKDFAEMLSQFKRGIEANIDDADWQAHYDLGIAYKEMGLLDEAIAEFQKALRSAEGRLRTAEALGTCFYEKGQFSVAGTVMRRAIEADQGGDERKIGLLYWTGRCEEEQQRVPEALVYYQRVFALDINFQDISARVRELAGTDG